MYTRFDYAHESHQAKRHVPSHWRSSWLLAVTTLALLVALAGGSQSGALAQAAPSIQLSPTSGPPGTVVTVVGEDFQEPAGTTVLITVDHPDRPSIVKSLLLPAGGAFETTFEVSDFAPGTYVVFALVGSTRADAEFTITVALVVPSIRIVPNAGPPGSNATIIGEGFSALPAGTRVHVDFDVSGRPASVGSTALTAAGTFEFTFAVPEFAPGTYPVFALVGSTRAETEFTITAALPDTTTTTTATTPTTTQPPPAAPSIRIIPDAAAPGTTVTVTGEDFREAAGTTVLITVDNPERPSIVKSLILPAGGTFQTTFVVPDFPTGRYLVFALVGSTRADTTLTITGPEGSSTLLPALVGAVAAAAVGGGVAGFVVWRRRVGRGTRGAWRSAPLTSVPPDAPIVRFVNARQRLVPGAHSAHRQGTRSHQLHSDLVKWPKVWRTGTQTS